jgi:hypothetical protein
MFSKLIEIGVLSTKQQVSVKNEESSVRTLTEESRDDDIPQKLISSTSQKVITKPIFNVINATNINVET